MITDADVNRLHLCYEKMTGFTLPMRSICDPRRMAWQRFLARGLTLADLELVIVYLKHEIRESRRNFGALRFSNLIEDLLRFEEELSMAKAWKRNAKPAQSAKERVSEQWSPVMGAKACPDSCVHVSDVIRAMREAAR